MNQNEIVAMTSEMPRSMSAPPATTSGTKATKNASTRTPATPIAKQRVTIARTKPSGKICAGTVSTWNSVSNGRTRKRSKRPSRMYSGTATTLKNSALWSSCAVIQSA